MALLLDIRRLDPFRDPDPLLDDSPDRREETQSCFRNPAFRGDAESVYLPVDEASTRISSNNNNNSSSSSIVNMVSSADSGIHLSGGDDASSVGCKSLDSGVFEGAPPRVAGATEKTPFKEHQRESLATICAQVFIPFLIAGIGTCGAGIVLGDVETWEVFQTVTELFVLVPTLLGLKGNLEMTLASRVSTQANLGKLDTWQEQWQMSWGNMALIQCQATVLSFLASGFATAMSVAGGGFQLDHALLVTASALCTAAAASLLLGAVTLAVVVASHKLHVNPDNVATPIASSLGDVTTLGLLAASSSALYKIRGNLLWSSVLVGVFVLLVPVWAYLSHRNPFVRQVLYTGWLPVIIAVVITSAGGFILEFSIKEFKGIAVFQPVINGVAGNLVAVQASRISTYFHRHCSPGDRPPDGAPVCVSPFAAFCGKSAHARTARLLLAMVIPGHLLFGYGITLAMGGGTALTPSFLPIYLAAAFVQIAVLLYVAHCLIQVLWRWKVDPDNSAIPLLTALGDLSGMACLSLAFYAHAAAWPPP